MRASRESWGRRAPNATKKARGAEHRKRHAVLMCSCGAPRFTISPTFGRSRSTPRPSADSTHTRVERKRAAPDHGSPSRTVVRAPTVHGAQTLRAGTALSSRAAPRIVRSDRFQFHGSGARCAGVTFCRLARRERRRHDGPTTSRPLVPRCRCRPGRPGAARGVRNR